MGLQLSRGGWGGIVIGPSRIQFRSAVKAIAGGDPRLPLRIVSLFTAIVLVAGVLAAGGVQITIGDVGGNRITGSAGNSAQSTFAPGDSSGELGTTGDSTLSFDGSESAGAVSALDSPSATQSSRTGAAASGTAPGRSGPLTASDRGVTAEAIKLGFLMMSGSSAESDYDPNGGTPGRYTKIANTWAKEINSQGGINGRMLQIVPDSAAIGSGGTDDMIRACKYLVKDQKVFGVVASLGFEADTPQMCVAKENETPLITVDPLPATRYGEAAPYLWCQCMNRDRIFSNWAQWLVRSRYVEPGKSVVGVIYEGLPYNAPSVEKTLLPQLEANGIVPAEVVRLSANFEQGAGELNNAVLQFRRANVDVVLPVVNLIYMANFMQAAEGQRYFPRYSATDLLFATSDFAPNWITPWPGDSFNGSRAVSWTNSGRGKAGHMGVFGDWWDSPFAKVADQVYAKHNKCAQGVYDCDQPEDPSERALTFGADLQRTQNYLIGSKILMFVEAARRAGPNLTRSAWAAAMGSIGTWDKTAMTPSFQFAPQKWDGANQMAEVKWFRDAEGGFAARRWHQIAPHAASAF